MKNAIEQEFNKYRKEITGAAAAMSEIEMLKESFMNSDLSYEEFTAAFDEYRDAQIKALEIAQDILSRGIPLGSKEFTEQHDNAWLQRLTMGEGTKKDAQARGEELQGQGLSVDEIMNKLLEEGY